MTDRYTHLLSPKLLLIVFLFLFFVGIYQLLAGGLVFILEAINLSIINME